MKAFLRVLAALGAMIVTGVLVLLWVFIVWPMFVQPAIADRDIAIAQSALRRGLTRGELKAMIGKQIPQPFSVSEASDGSDTLIEYSYKDDLCTSYYKSVEITWVHDRVAGWRVWPSSVSCFS